MQENEEFKEKYRKWKFECGKYKAMAEKLKGELSRYTS
jgi:hypothetical protein